MIEDIAAAVRKGRCVLFLGAGVHAPSPDGRYPSELAPPFGGALAQKLADESGYLVDYPKGNPRELPRVAMHYELKPGKSRATLLDKVRTEVETGKAASPVLRALGALPFPLIVTTNYDSFFEDSLPQTKKPEFRYYERVPNTESPSPDFVDPTEQTPGILKIHGDFTRRDSIVLTDEDYIHFVMRMGGDEKTHPFPLTARYFMQRMPTLFIGYSLLDYNVRLFLYSLRFRVDPGNRQSMYSADPYPDLLVRKVWQDERKWVWFVENDVWSFVPALYRAVTGTEMPA